MATAAQIRAERAAMGVAQDEMARQAGIPRSTYIRIEQGKRVVDVTQLARLCGVYRLPLSEFMQRVQARVRDG